MKKLLLLVMLFWGTSTFANKQDFCAGFVEGFKRIMGSKAYVPSCNFSYQIPAAGSTYFQAGIEAGVNVGKNQQSSPRYKPLRKDRGVMGRDSRDRY